MGLQDRDYMRNPDSANGLRGPDPPFRMSGGLIVGVVLILVALAALIVQGFRPRPALEYDDSEYLEELYASGYQSIHVNTATRDELLTIPGMSERIADGIVARRPFKKSDELLDVRGVGEMNIQLFLMHLYGFEDFPEPRIPRNPRIPDA